MEKLSGLVLDHYDDGSGEVLRGIYPQEGAVPEVVKQAHYMSPEQRAGLPADVFALELIDGSVVLRKFACIDPGNTALSIEYFLKTGHKLPEMAQRRAAENLVTACGWYGLEVPEQLQKVAFGLNSLMSLAAAPSVLKGTKQQIGQNMSVARASGGAVNPEALVFKSPMAQGG